MFRLQYNCPWKHGKTSWSLASLFKFQLLPSAIFFACACVAVFAQTQRAGTQARLPVLKGTDLFFTHVSFGGGPSLRKNQRHCAGQSGISLVQHPK